MVAPPHERQLAPQHTQIIAPSLRPSSPWSGSLRGRRWGIVLLGGDGVRLRPLTRFISGDDRPKQFCPIFHGGISLLDRTRQRIAHSISAEQTLFAVTRNHHDFYAIALGGQESQRIVQPANRGTVPPILHSLLSIANLDRKALVAILPCDHHFSDEALFAATIESAFDLAAEHPGSVTLLAAQPTHAAVEYGWIETDSISASVDGTPFRVRAFHEKPPAHLANALFRQGSLWNTFVMIGHVRAFLSMIEMTRPDLLDALSAPSDCGPVAIHIESAVYEGIASADFSRQVLALKAERLNALKLGPIVWSDLGDPDRTVAAMSGENTQPGWVHPWRLSKAAGISAFAANAA